MRGDSYGLCSTAESCKLACLQELDIEGMSFSYVMSLPHRLEKAAFRNASIKIMVLDNCKCATTAPTGKDGAGQLSCQFLTSAAAQ